jgi:hypothetical protein
VPSKSQAGFIRVYGERILSASVVSWCNGSLLMSSCLQPVSDWYQSWVGAALTSSAYSGAAMLALMLAEWCDCEEMLAVKRS